MLIFGEEEEEEEGYAEEEEEKRSVEHDYKNEYLKRDGYALGFREYERSYRYRVTHLPIRPDYPYLLYSWE